MNVLILAPHNDDEILGAGGTISKYAKAGNSVFVCEVTSGDNWKRLQNEAKNAHNILGVKQSFFLNIPVGHLLQMDQFALNDAITRIVMQIKPEVVFLPFMGDMHQDHEAVTKSAMVALRPIGDYSVRKILMYETLSETDWHIPDSEHSFVPNVWIDITDNIQDKLDAIKCFQDQLKSAPHPRSLDAIIALAKHRGMTISRQFAESFMLVREIL